jgi:hypothetical protein
MALSLNGYQVVEEKMWTVAWWPCAASLAAHV